MNGFLWTLLVILGCSMVGIGIGLGVTEHNKPRYERWDELSAPEIDLMRECARQLPYTDCLENVYQMRQIGIQP